MGGALVVNGFKLGHPRRERKPVTAEDFAKLKHQLSNEASKVSSAARAEGLPEAAIYERLARFYRASDLVQSVRYTGASLAVTYRDRPTSPEHFLLARPRSAKQKEEDEQRRRKENRAEILRLKRMLEAGGVVVITPAERMYISKKEAIPAREAIERYQRTGSSTGLADYVPRSVWTYLRQPALEIAK